MAGILYSNLMFGSAYAQLKTDWTEFEIIKGDSTFMINRSASIIWWILPECKKSIPLETTSKQSFKDNKTSSLKTSILSQKMQDTVKIGSRQIQLQQQFRFDLANDSATSLYVYNSIRGAWSPIAIKRNDACSTDTSCLQRMELPVC